MLLLYLANKTSSSHYREDAGKRNARIHRIHSTSTVTSKFAWFKSSWVQCGGHTALKGVQNTHDWSRQTQALCVGKNCVWVSWITPSLQRLCINGIVSSQHASKPPTVISSTVFDSDVFAAITVTFLAFVDQSNSCMPICQFGLTAVVCYDFVLCNTWQLSNSQGRVVTLIR